MDPRSLHQIATGTPPSGHRTRTNQPVRRNSRNAGGIEISLWKTHNTFSKSEHNARMRAAEEFDHETKLPGRRNGALGAIGLEVLRFMLRLRGKKDGRLDPTYKFIADRIRRSRSAVGQAIARLKAAGFLEWIRRCQPIENAEPDEQQTEQIANAYILQMPATASERVRRMLRRPSEIVRAMADKLGRERKLASATTEEIIAEARNPELRATLARMQAAIDSANPPSGQTEAL